MEVKMNGAIKALLGLTKVAPSYKKGDHYRVLRLHCIYLPCMVGLGPMTFN